MYNDNDYNGGTHNLQRSLYGRRRVSIASTSVRQKKNIHIIQKVTNEVCST